LSDSRSMADTPRELDRVNSILLTDDVLASGPRTPWSPIRESTGRRPGPIAATRLLDLDDEGFERPAEYSGRGAATKLMFTLNHWHCFIKEIRTQIWTSKPAIAGKPRCSVYKLWQKYKCESHLTSLYPTTLTSTKWSFNCFTSLCLYLMQNYTAFRR